MKALSITLATAGLFAITAPAQAVTTLYGDDDGFGVGVSSGTMNPNVNNASFGEAAGTDVRLIGLAFPPFAPFAPTGSFASFTPGTVTSAILTMRLGSFSPLSPVDGPNMIYLNGLLVDPSFINGFTANTNFDDFAETRSIALDPSFYAALGTGNVSLAGTRLSEGSGYGSFQVDFLRLDLTTDAAVPEPATWAMMLLGFGAIGARMRRRYRGSMRIRYA